MDVHQWVREARSLKKWTQQRLADEVGVTKANVSGWETQRHKPSFRQMTKISHLTGMPLPLEQEQPSAPTVARVDGRDAELTAVQVMLMALVGTHADKAALLRTFDAIVSGMRMNGVEPSDDAQRALERYRRQLVA